MFGFSFGEILFIAAVALIALGPKQLPEVARSLGRLLNELKRASGDFQRTFLDANDSQQSKILELQQSIQQSLEAKINPATVSPAPAQSDPHLAASDGDAEKQMSFELAPSASLSPTHHKNES